MIKKKFQSKILKTPQGEPTLTHISAILLNLETQFFKNTFLNLNKLNNLKKKLLDFVKMSHFNTEKQHIFTHFYPLQS